MILQTLSVAPLVGAWIETYYFFPFLANILSHPSWVRGLKRYRCNTVRLLPCVAPLVGAWIETGVLSMMLYNTSSHPSWVRGLKPGKRDYKAKSIRSHPSWVRGLKLLYLLTKKQ